MGRRLAFSLLAVVEAATLLGGTAAAASLAGRPTRVPATPQAATVLTTLTVVKPAPVARPAAQPPVKARPKPRHHTAHPPVRPAVRRTVVAAVRTPRLSPQQLMDHAVARIPGYHPGDATWIISAKYGHWGITDLGAAVVYVSPTVPADRMQDVVLHEWSHVLSVKVYGGDVITALSEMNRVFGGDGIAGAERAADCMAIELGAHWTHYTSCNNAAWRSAARRLLARQQL